MQLDGVKGVGSATEEQLNEAGVTTVEELADADAEDLTDAGLSESKAEKLIRRAGEETVILQSGARAKDERDSKEYLSTGMEAMNEMLGGGFRQEQVIGIPGEPASGKTQLTFRSIGAAIEQTDKPAIYIETEKERFDVERIAALSDVSQEEVEERVWRVKAYGLDRQKDAYRAIEDKFEEAAIVAVDSFTARFRLSDKFEGRGGLTDRNAEFKAHLNRIESMAETLNCPVLLTLQVMGNPTRYGKDTTTWGGTLVDHIITYFVRMSQAKAEFRSAELRGHPSRPDDSVLLSIHGEGIAAHSEK